MARRRRSYYATGQLPYVDGIVYKIAMLRRCSPPRSPAHSRFVTTNDSCVCAARRLGADVCQCRDMAWPIPRVVHRHADRDMARLSSRPRRHRNWDRRSKWGRLSACATACKAVQHLLPGRALPCPREKIAAADRRLGNESRRSGSATIRTCRIRLRVQRAPLIGP